MEYFDNYDFRAELDALTGGFTSFADMCCGDLDDGLIGRGADALDWMK